MDRTEWEQRNLDLVEEDKLKKHDAVQANFHGMWRDLLGGCPHLHKPRPHYRAKNSITTCPYQLRENHKWERIQGRLYTWQSL